MKHQFDETIYLFKGEQLIHVFSKTGTLIERLRYLGIFESFQFSTPQKIISLKGYVVLRTNLFPVLNTTTAKDIVFLM